MRFDRKSAPRAATRPGPAGAACFRHRIDRVQKGETVEIGVSGVNGADTILPHQDGGVRVEDQIARDSGHFGKHLRCRMSVTIGLDQKSERGRRKQSVEKGPRLIAGEGLRHDAGMGHHAEKLVDNAPSEIPGSRLRTAGHEEFTARVMFGSVLVRTVNQDVGVDDEQSYPSITL